MSIPALAVSSPVNFFISQAPPGKLPADVAPSIDEIYNAMQQVIQTFVNYCGIGPQPSISWTQLAGSPTQLLAGNLNRLYVIASENIAAGAIVNLFLSGGVLKARNANATNNTKPADGYCSTPGGIAIGTAGEVILGHGLVGIAGLTVGTRYFLSTANGLVANGPAVGAGNIEQYIGIAIDATHLFVNIGYWIQH